MEATDHDLAGQWLDRVAGITPADAIAEQVLLAESYDRLSKSSNDPQFAQKASQIYARVEGDPKASGVSLTAAAFRAEGAASVAKLARSYAGSEREVRPATVNGAAGAVIFVTGRPSSIMGFVVRGGRIAAIDVLADPARIARIDLSALTG